MNFFRFLSPLLLALKESFSSNSRIITLTKLDYLSFFSLFFLVGVGGVGGVGRRREKGEWKELK